MMILYLVLLIQELPQAVCEILGLQDSEVTTPDSDNGEDENVGMTVCPPSAFQSNSLPVLTASGGRDDNPTEIPVSPNVSRLTPAWSFFEETLCYNFFSSTWKVEIWDLGIDRALRFMERMCTDVLALKLYKDLN